MMVTGRKVSETADEVRYEFGLDRQFDRVLTIDKNTWQANAEDGCFDSAAGGTGGCPYAPGAAGNLATEDLVYFLDAIGLQHGIDLDGVLTAARFIADALGKPLATKVGQAGGWDPATGAATGRG